MGETPLSVRPNLADAIAVYGNPDTVGREKAIDAIAEGRAAFWTMSSYSSTSNSGLPYTLNSGVGITEAIAEAYSDWRYAYNPKLKTQQRLAALDTIVPLNRKAVNSLALAYERAGSFRDDAELELRAKRDTRRQTKREPFTYANFKAGRV
ncbi:hypothetical protein [Mesorhizobium sp. A556]